MNESFKKEEIQKRLFEHQHQPQLPLTSQYHTFHFILTSVVVVIPSSTSPIHSLHVLGRVSHWAASQRGGIKIASAASTSTTTPYSCSSRPIHSLDVLARAPYLKASPKNATATRAREMSTFAEFLPFASRSTLRIRRNGLFGQ